MAASLGMMVAMNLLLNGGLPFGLLNGGSSLGWNSDAEDSRRSRGNQYRYNDDGRRYAGGGAGNRYSDARRNDATSSSRHRESRSSWRQAASSGGRHSSWPPPGGDGHNDGGIGTFWRAAVPTLLICSLACGYVLRQPHLQNHRLVAGIRRVLLGVWQALPLGVYHWQWTNAPADNAAAGNNAGDGGGGGAWGQFWRPFRQAAADFANERPRERATTAEASTLPTESFIPGTTGTHVAIPTSRRMRTTKVRAQ